MRSQQNAFVRWAVMVLTLAALTLVSGACRKSPIEPSPTPHPVNGQITISYQPPAICLSAGTPYAVRCDRAKVPAGVSGISWPAGTGAGVDLIPNPDGTLTATTMAPSSDTGGAGRLRIVVGDPWLCPPVQICDVQLLTGKNITINGTRLADGDRETSFLFYPPEVVR